MTGYEKAKATAEKLKKESAASRTLQQNDPTLPSADIDPAVLAFYQDNAGAGIGDIPMFTSIPTLRTHTDDSTNNELEGGGEPKVGQLYFTETREAYDAVEANLLCIRRCWLPDFNGSELQRHYLVAGIMSDINKPFIIYVKGMSYNKIWDLQDDLKPWVKMKRIPMFALRVKIYTELEAPQNPKFKNKKRHVVKYEVVMNKDGQPVLETDLSRLEWLKEGVVNAEIGLDDLINSKGQPDNPTTKVEEVADARLQAGVTEHLMGEDGESSESTEDEDDVPF